MCLRVIQRVMAVIGLCVLVPTIIFADRGGGEFIDRGANEGATVGEAIVDYGEREGVPMMASPGVVSQMESPVKQCNTCRRFSLASDFGGDVVYLVHEDKRTIQKRIIHNLSSWRKVNESADILVSDKRVRAAKFSGSNPGGIAAFLQVACEIDVNQTITKDIEVFLSSSVRESKEKACENVLVALAVSGIEITIGKDNESFILSH